MARRTPASLILLAVLTVSAVSCSSTESGTAVLGSTATGSTAATTSQVTTPPSTTEPSSTAPLSTTSSTMASTSSASSTTSPSSTSSSSTASSTTSPSSTAPTSTASSSTRPSTAPASTRSSSTAVPTTGSAPSFALCPGVNPADARAIVRCLRTSLSTFWSGELNEVVDQPVVVEPTIAQVPPQCRSAITLTTAFTCQINNTVYLNTGLIEAAQKDFSPSRLPYVIATVMGHEIGHVVQAAVKQPGYADTGSSQSISQRIEQQADCLDGVWAHAVIADRKLDQDTFVDVTNTFITSISSNPEIAGHGTPPVRAAALAKGLKNGRPQDCGLATFS